MGSRSRVFFWTVSVAIILWELVVLARWQGMLPLQKTVPQLQVEKRFRAAAPAAETAVVAQQAASAAAPANEAAPQGVQPQQEQQTRPAWPTRTAVALAPPPAESGYYDQLRTRINWIETRMGRETLKAPDMNSRMLLAKSAAQRARLDEVGLSFKDVYGIINAETSWVPRLGASKDGTPNLGIAQFEPATARALGLRNPNDLVEAVHVAARHMKEAALWSADRIAHLRLGEAQRAEKLREGVSIYYNLSSRGRSMWNGTNTARLPVQTRLHIFNAQIGARMAGMMDAQLQTASMHGGRNGSIG